jgi:hypothetical protein
MRVSSMLLDTILGVMRHHSYTLDYTQLGLSADASEFMI